LNVLLRGLCSKPSDLKRGFIVESIPDKKGYVIQLMSNRLYLNEKQTVDLCELVDRFAEVYIERLEQVEKQMGVRGFSVVEGYRDGFCLVKMNAELWRVILDYGRANDYINTNSEQSVFDSRSNCMHVWPYKEGHKNLSDYVFSFYADPFIYTGPVKIVWQPSKPYSGQFPYDQHAEIFWAQFWDCHRVYQWFLSSVIPRALYFKETKKRWWKIKTPSFEEFEKKFDASKYVTSSLDHRLLCSVSDASSAEKIIESLGTLQNFFHISSFNELSARDFRVCGEALKICLQNEAPEEGHFWDYISGNIGGRKKNKTQALRALDHFSQTDTDWVSHFKVDLLLRCFIHFVEDQVSTFSSQSLKTSIDGLLNLEKLMLRENTMMRFSERLFEITND